MAAYAPLTRQGGGDGRRVRPAVPRRWLDRPLVVAGLREPHDRHQLRRRLRRRVHQGVPLQDVQSTYEAAVRNATVTPPGNPNNSNVGRKGLQQSVFLGFTPTTVGEGVSGLSRATSTTTASRRWPRGCPAKLDQATRDRYRTEAAYFLNRSQNYVKMFDRRSVSSRASTRTTCRARRPRSTTRSTGAATTPRPTAGTSRSAPQDGQGLANLYGGRAAAQAGPVLCDPRGRHARRRLRRRDPRDARGARRPHGPARDEQPGVAHIPVPDYAGQPSKTARRSARSCRGSTPAEIGQGYAGDEDNGETSAWWLFSAMGFYPLQMGEGHYAVGSPLFTKMAVHLDNGKTLTINAPNNSAKNIYVTGLSVNRVARDQAWIDRDDRDGGTVTFTMGSAPTSWGTAQQLPSITTGDQPPTPLDDLTGSGQGRRRCRLGRTDRQHVAHRDHAAHGSGGHVPVRRTEERGPAVHADLGGRRRHPHRLAARGVQRRHDLEGGRRPQPTRPGARLQTAVQGQEPRSVPVLPADRHRRRAATPRSPSSSSSGGPVAC